MIVSVMRRAYLYIGEVLHSFTDLLSEIHETRGCLRVEPGRIVVINVGRHEDGCRVSRADIPQVILQRAVFAVLYDQVERSVDCGGPDDSYNVGVTHFLE